MPKLLYSTDKKVVKSRRRIGELSKEVILFKRNMTKRDRALFNIKLELKKLKL